MAVADAHDVAHHAAHGEAARIRQPPLVPLRRAPAAAAAVPPSKVAAEHETTTATATATSSSSSSTSSSSGGVAGASAREVLEEEEAEDGLVMGADLFEGAPEPIQIARVLRLVHQ